MMRRTHGFALFCKRLLTTATLVVGLASGCVENAFSQKTKQGAGRRLPSAPAPSSSTDALVSEGVAALERGDMEAARASFRRAVEINPRDEAAHTYLGVLADRAGQLAEAERHFAAVVRVAPRSPSARNNHGAILLRMGRVSEAAAEFEASLQEDRTQTSALVNLAQIRFNGGSPESLRAARELFTRAAGIAPDASISRALVITSLRLGDHATAAATYRDYTSRLSSAPPELTAPPARAELGAALLEAALPDEAIEELSAAVAADSSNVQAIIHLAESYLLRRDIAAAGRTLEGAVARGLNASPIYAALAGVYVQSGHIENAIPAMRLAVQYDPQSEEYPFRYAMLLIDTKAPQAAIIRMEQSVKKFPRSPRIWFALGVAYFVAQKVNEAGSVFDRVITLDAKFAPAYAYRGLTFEDQGRYGEAVALYEKAIAVDDRVAAARYLAASAILKQAPSETARAEVHLKRALALDPNFTQARLALGKICLRTERLEEAARYLEQVTAAEPDLAEGFYQLGQAYRRLKRAADAQAVFDKFKQLSDTQRDQERNEQRKIARRLANVLF